MPLNTSKLDELKSILFALCICQRDGCTIKKLADEYYESEGQHVPYKEYGYDSLLHLLDDMKNMVRIEYSNGKRIVKGIPSSASSHISALVAGQKPSGKRPKLNKKQFRSSHYYPNVPVPRMHIPAEILSSLISLVKQCPGGINIEDALSFVRKKMANPYVSMSDVTDQLKDLSHEISVNGNILYPRSDTAIHHSETLDNVKVYAAGDETSDHIFDLDDEDDFEFVCAGHTDNSDIKKSNAMTKRTTSSFIEETVSKRQDKMTDADADRLEEDKEDRENCDYNFNEKNSQFYWKMNSNELHKEETNYLNDEHVDMLINDNIKCRLDKLIQKYPSGISCAQLPDKYLEEYKVNLNYMELGFSSVREFASHLPNIFHCRALSDTGDYILYSAKSGIPRNKTDNKPAISSLLDLHIMPESIWECENEVLPTIVSIDTCKALIPDSVLSIGECVAQISVENLANRDKPYLEVYICEVFTPTFFWIQLRKQKKKFDSFMTELHNFYASEDQNYIIPSVVFEKGLNCACEYNGIWHRGIIKTVQPDLQITVFFYDYGTLKTYPSNKLRYLHRKFSYIPAQAIPCALVNVKPYTGTKWTRSATHAFATRVSNIPLVATIASINEQDNSMVVTLTDTSEEDDIHINDWLVEHKLALHGKMVDSVQMKDLMLYTEENLLFSPELCYDPEMVITKEDKDEISKEPPANRPLILPKSTLVDKTVGPPPGFKCPAVSLGMEKSTVDSLPELNNDPPRNQNFTEKSSLQSGSNVYNSQIMTPGQLIDLWNKNLELQMQITEAFQALLPKMTPGTANACNDYNGSANDSLHKAHVASHLNLFDGLNIAKNMAAKKSTMNESIYMNSLPKNTHTHRINSVMPNIYELNTVPMMFGRQNTKTIDPVCTLSQNFDKLSISQNTAFQTSLLSHETPSGNSTKIMAQENGKSNDTDDERLLNGMFKETNPFRLSLAGKLRIPSPEEDHGQNFFTSNYNNTSTGNYKPIHTVNVSSQTTDDQNTAPSTQYRYQKNFIQKNLIHDPQRQCNIPNMYFNTEEYHNGHTRMNHDSSASKINTSYSDKAYSNGAWLVDNKNSSSDDIRRQETSVELQTSIFQNNYETKSNHNYPYPYKDSHFQINLNEEDEGSFSMESVLQRPQKDFDRAPSRQKVGNKSEFRVQNFPDSADSIYTNGWPGNSYNDLKSNEPSWSPITGFTSPLSIENTDEGYQTRPSTSNLLENALLLPQTVTETSSTRDVIKAVHKHNNMSTNSWKNIANYNSENDESKLFSQSIFSHHPTVNNCEPNETWNANGLLRNTENLITEEKTSDAKHREEVCKKFELFKCGPDLYCRPFELPKCLVHIFHYKEEGWILIADFVDAFAEFKSLTYMINLLHILDLKIEYLDLEQYSFSRIPQLQSKLRRISEDGKAGPPRVHLMPLEDSMKVLLKLGIITTSEIYSAVVKKEFVIGSVTHQISMVITAYNECAKVIEGCDRAEYS